MTDTDLVIGATRRLFALGTRAEVSIRRQPGEPWISMWVFIVRNATWEEYVAYHEAHGLCYTRYADDRYYAFLMD